MLLFLLLTTSCFLLRLQMDHLFGVVESTGTPDARAALAAYKEQAPRLARDMKRRGAAERALEAGVKRDALTP